MILTRVPSHPPVTMDRQNHAGPMKILSYDCRPLRSLSTKGLTIGLLAIPRPPLAVQKGADNRLESLTTVAPSDVGNGLLQLKLQPFPFPLLRLPHRHNCLNLAKRQDGTPLSLCRALSAKPKKWRRRPYRAFPKIASWNASVVAETQSVTGYLRKTEGI